MSQAQPSKLQQLLTDKFGTKPAAVVTNHTVHSLAVLLAPHLKTTPEKIVEAANAKIVSEVRALHEAITTLKRADALVEETIKDRNLMAEGVDARIAALLGA